MRQAGFDVNVSQTKHCKHS